MLRSVLAAGAGAAVCVGLYSYFTGKGLAEVVGELRDAVGVGCVPELQPGSMAVSGTSVEGVVPTVSLGRQDSALFKRRANYRPVEPVLTDVGGVPISDDVAVPGSLAVSGAAIDGSTPKLDLGNHFSVSPASIPSTSEEDGSIISPASIFVRRQSSKTFNVESPVMGVTASQLEGKTTASVSLPSDGLNQEAVPSSPAGTLFERRKLQKMGSKEGLVDNTPQGNVSMAASAALMDGEAKPVHLGGASLLERRKSSRSMESPVPPAIIAQMDNAFQEEPPVSALIHTSAFTSMNESPTIKLGGSKGNLFDRRQRHDACSEATRACGDQFKIGVIRAEHDMLEGLVRDARVELAEREAGLNGCGASDSNADKQAREWHTKQVQEGKEALSKAEGRLEECRSRLSMARTDCSE